jgi:hypothetical protein
MDLVTVRLVAEAVVPIAISATASDVVHNKTFQVAIRDVRPGHYEPLVPLMLQLSRFTTTTLDLFDRFFSDALTAYFPAGSGSGSHRSSAASRAFTYAS